MKLCFEKIKGDLENHYNLFYKRHEFYHAENQKKYWKLVAANGGYIPEGIVCRLSHLKEERLNEIESCICVLRTMLFRNETFETAVTLNSFKLPSFCKSAIVGVLEVKGPDGFDFTLSDLIKLK